MHLTCGPRTLIPVPVGPGVAAIPILLVVAPPAFVPGPTAGAAIGVAVGAAIGVARVAAAGAAIGVGLVGSKLLGRLFGRGWLCCLELEENRSSDLRAAIGFRV
jgi:hypothetical protein